MHSKAMKRSPAQSFEAAPGNVCFLQNKQIQMFFFI